MVGCGVISADMNIRPRLTQEGEVALSPQQERLFRRHKAAWAYFESLPPGYRKRAIWHIVSPKQPETRERRLAALIDACARGVRLR